MNIGLRQRLKESFENHLEKPIVIYKDYSLTYASALSHIAGLFEHLAGVVSHGGLVGVMAERGPSAYVGTLAAFITGRSSVTLSPKMPAHRLRRIAESAGLNAVLLSTAQIPLFKRVFSESVDPITGVVIDGDPSDALTEYVGRNKLIFARMSAEFSGLWIEGCDDPSLAYLLFTSGSTGSPKGVPVSSSNLCSYIDSVSSFYKYNEEDRHSQTFDLSFDLAMHDLLVTACTGGTLVPFLDADLLSASHHAQNHGVTCWFSVPSQAALMAKARTLSAGTMGSVRLSLFCGEPLSWDLAANWQAAAPNSVVENLYGPTEATIAMTRYRFQPEGDAEEPRRGLVPIGFPFPNMEIRLDPVPGGQENGTGTQGELMITGSQLTSGYWNSKAQTEKAFISSDGEPDKVWYRTGDVAELSSANCLHFVGRSDQQIKLGGHRVEIAEVESELREVSGSAACAVVPWPANGPDVQGLMGFIESASITGSQIRKWLSERLPTYMVPKKIYVVEQLPRSTSGKIDRSQLMEKVKHGGIASLAKRVEKEESD